MVRVNRPRGRISFFPTDPVFSAVLTGQEGQSNTLVAEPACLTSPGRILEMVKWISVSELR